jgi:hypothetical protein
LIRTCSFIGAGPIGGKRPVNVPLLLVPRTVLLAKTLKRIVEKQLPVRETVVDQTCKVAKAYTHLCYASGKISYLLPHKLKRSPAAVVIRIVQVKMRGRILVERHSVRRFCTLRTKGNAHPALLRYPLM